MPTIVAVQALRAIAALAVAICHFDQVRLMLEGHGAERNPLYPLASGVDLFFIISGFVMVYSSTDLFATKGAPRTFLSRRIARIVPIYWVATALAIPLMSLSADVSTVAMSLFFIPFRAATGNVVPLHGVGWTLNFEMYFYTLFSVAILWPQRKAVSALCATLTLIVVFGWLFKPNTAAPLFWSDPIVLEFAIGMLLAQLYIGGIRLPPKVRLLLVALGIAAIGYFEPRMPPSGLRFLQWGLPAAMIFAGVVMGEQIKFGALTKATMLLGDSSYALYLLHPLVSAILLRAWADGLNQYPMPLVLFFGAMAAVGLSVAVFLCFERRSTRFLRRVLTAWPRPSRTARSLIKQTWTFTISLVAAIFLFSAPWFGFAAQSSDAMAVADTSAPSY